MLLRSAISGHIYDPSHIVIVGSGPRAQELFAQITSESEGHLHVVGFVDTALPAGTAGARCLCSLDGLEQVLMTQEVDEVQVALPIKSCYAEIQRTIQICERVGVPVKYSASLFTHTRQEPRVELSAGGPLLSVPVGVVGPRLVAKRAIDIFGAGMALILLGPVMLVVAVAVKVTSPGPVFFSQLRYGRGRRIFRMHKFRTMVENAEARQSEVESLNEKAGPIFKIRQDPRTTWLGSILRHTSIDELPQLWNVVRGGHVTRRPAPDVAPRRETLRCSLADAAFQRLSGHHGTVAGERAERPSVRAVDPTGPDVHRRVVADSRPSDHGTNAARRPVRSGGILRVPVTARQATSPSRTVRWVTTSTTGRSRDQPEPVGAGHELGAPDRSRDSRKRLST